MENTNQKIKKINALIYDLVSIGGISADENAVAAVLKDKLNKILAEKTNKDLKKIEIDTQVKTPGMYTANIKLYEGVVAKLKVRVVGI